jgi:hypothetical protein
MEHIEEAGIHSGDSACVAAAVLARRARIATTIARHTRAIAKALKVVGLMNVQYAIKDDTVYVLEVNPRASRTCRSCQGDRRAARQDRGAVMAGKTLCSRSCASRRRHDPRAGDEVDRRGDGRVIAYIRASIPARRRSARRRDLLPRGRLAGVHHRTHARSTRDLERHPARSRRTSRPPHAVSCGVCEMVVGTRRQAIAVSALRRDARSECRAAIRASARRARRRDSADAARVRSRVIVNDQLTAVLEHTVIGTVQLLADRGYWQFGVIVLIAGVVIPIVELVGMLWLLVRVRFPDRKGLVRRTHVYRVLRRLVRWPMIIPFIAAIAAPIVNFRGIDDIVAGPGATPLFMVVVLTMVAVRLFEPRLMWKTAGEVR